MRDLELLLQEYPHIADQTLFRDVAVTETMYQRIRTVALDEGVLTPRAGTGTTASPVERPARRRRLLVAVPSLAAAMAAMMALLLPGAPVAAALSVGLDQRVAVFELPEPPARQEVAGTPDHERLGPDPTVTIPVEVDPAYSLWQSWSPDGSRLVYGKDGDLYLYETISAASRNLTETPDRIELMPTWSPDGRRLAFTSRPLEPGEGPDGFGWESLTGALGGEPAVVDLDGGGYRVLDSGLAMSPLTWSPDGASVAYAIESRLFVFDLQSSERRQVPLDGFAYVGAPAWSPDGDTILVYTSVSTVEPTREEVVSGSIPAVEQAFVLVDLESGRSHPLYEYAGPFVPRSPGRWSSDGSFVALVFRQETALTDPMGLIVVDREGESSLLSTSGLITQVAWDPGRNTLAVLDESDPTAITLYDLSEGDGGPRTLTSTAPITGIGWKPGS